MAAGRFSSAPGQTSPAGARLFRRVSAVKGWRCSCSTVTHELGPAPRPLPCVLYAPGRCLAGALPPGARTRRRRVLRRRVCRRVAVAAVRLSSRSRRTTDRVRSEVGRPDQYFLRAVIFPARCADRQSGHTRRTVLRRPLVVSGIPRPDRRPGPAPPRRARHPGQRQHPQDGTDPQLVCQTSALSCGFHADPEGMKLAIFCDVHGNLPHWRRCWQTSHRSLSHGRRHTPRRRTKRSCKGEWEACAVRARQPPERENSNRRSFTAPSQLCFCSVTWRG